MQSIDDLLGQIQARLGLEAEEEYEVLEEIRGHLEESVLAAKLQGMNHEQALQQAAAAFGIEQSAQALHQTHKTWGIGDALALAAVPVLLTIVLRWLIFSPDGTAAAWQWQQSWSNLWLVTSVLVVVPIWYFSRRLYLVGLWLFFWAISIGMLLWASQRW